jgi:opacity protein-like surface antigen
MAQCTKTTSWLSAAASAALLVAAPTAAAQEGDLEGFFIEIPVGVGTPVGDYGNEGMYDSSFWTGVNLGYLFSVGGGTVAVGPALDVQYSPGNVDQNFTPGDGGEDDIYLGRFRAIGGARLLVGFGSAYMLMRVGVGVDYVHASWDPPIYDRDGDDSDAAAGMVVGLGMGYRFTDLIGLNFLLDFPIGFHNEDDDPDPVDWDGEMIDLLASVAIVFNL